MDPVHSITCCIKDISLINLWHCLFSLSIARWFPSAYRQAISSLSLPKQNKPAPTYLLALRLLPISFLFFPNKILNRWSIFYPTVSLLFLQYSVIQLSSLQLHQNYFHPYHQGPPCCQINVIISQFSFYMTSLSHLTVDQSLKHFLYLASGFSFLSLQLFCLFSSPFSQHLNICRTKT